MNQLRRVIFSNANLKPSKGFLALKDANVRKQVDGFASPKLEALAEVLNSLSNAEMEYLNALISEKALVNNRSILENKMINTKGYTVQPISYFHQQNWINNQWKQTNLLQFALNDLIEELDDKVETEVVKENYDVELSSVDAAQKIKIIKALRELFGLGLKEAKDLADKTPSMLKKNMKREQAQKLKKTLEASGCVVTLK